MGILDFIMRFKPNSKKLGVLMLGLDNSGKSSILHQLSSEEDITHITPTQGFRIKSLVAHGVKLNVWDVGGQRSMRSYWRQYFDETDVLIFVVDSADHERMVEASEEFSFLLEEEKTAGIPILVFANKQDLPEAMQAREVAEVLQLDALRDRAWHIQACSAKTFEGVAEGMEWIVKQMRPKASLGRPKDLPPNGKTAASSA